MFSTRSARGDAFTNNTLLPRRILAYGSNMGSTVTTAAIVGACLVSACAVGRSAEPADTDTVGLETDPRCNISVMIDENEGSSNIARCGGNPDRTAPSLPQNLTVRAATCGALTLAWTRSTDPSGVQLYRIYRDEDVAEPHATVTPTEAGCAVTETCTWSDPIATQKELRTYRISAVDNATAHNATALTDAVEGTSASCSGSGGELAYAGATPTHVESRGVAVDGSDGYVVGTATDPEGMDRLVLTKYSGGSVAWTVDLGGADGNAKGAAVAVDKSNGLVYATGSFAGTIDLAGSQVTAKNATDILLMQFDASTGDLTRWYQFSSCWGSSSCDGNADDAGEALAVDDAGNVYLGGTSGADIDFNAGESGGEGFAKAPAMTSLPIGFVVRFDLYPLDTSLTSAWQWTFGDPTDTQTDAAVRSIALGPCGGTTCIAVAGDFKGTMWLNGQTVTSRGGTADIFAGLYEADIGVDFGTLWETRLGDCAASCDPRDQHAYATTFDAGGNLWIAGDVLGQFADDLTTFHVAPTAYLAKLDPGSGARASYQSFAAQDPITQAFAASHAYGLAASGDAIALTGHMMADVHFDPAVGVVGNDSAYVAVFGLDGSSKFARASQAGAAVGRAVALDGGAPTIAGTCAAGVTFGGDELAAGGFTASFTPAQ